MYSGKIIDFHAHIFPDKIAKKATENIGRFYGIEMSGNGSVNALLQSASAFNVEKFIVHSTATTHRQVNAINDFIFDEISKESRFIGFMTLHPDMTKEEIDEAVDLNISRGMKGIKLHPDFQKFHVDDKNAYKIYESAEGKLPILFHAGDSRYDFSEPKRIASVARDFPSLTIVAAHLGGYSRWNEVSVYEGLDNVYFDSSSSSYYVKPEENAAIIKTLGIDNVFFGTDFPMWDFEGELKRISSLPLTDGELEKIFYKNAEKFLDI